MKNNYESEQTDLCFFGSDPGAVKHGNFINYYSFHKVQERINNLHPLMFPTPLNNQLVCLDIGCNTGDLTKALYEYTKGNNPNCDIRLLGVDIDSSLIERAKESIKNPDITFSTSDIMTENGRLLIHNFLTTCKTKLFDVIFCFSVTMWIHLNNGDEGFIEFLNYLKSISKTIIIEPQPWKCYRNAQRRVTKAGNPFELYKSLKIKSEIIKVIENILTAKSFCKIYESSSSSWDRTVKSFQSINQFINQ